MGGVVPYHFQDVRDVPSTSQLVREDDAATSVDTSHLVNVFLPVRCIPRRMLRSRTEFVIELRACTSLFHLCPGKASDHVNNTATYQCKNASARA